MTFSSHLAKVAGQERTTFPTALSQANTLLLFGLSQLLPGMGGPVAPLGTGSSPLSNPSCAAREQRMRRSVLLCSSQDQVQRATTASTGGKSSRRGLGFSHMNL